MEETRRFKPGDRVSFSFQGVRQKGKIVALVGGSDTAHILTDKRRVTALVISLKRLRPKRRRVWVLEASLKGERPPAIRLERPGCLESLGMKWIEFVEVRKK